MFKLTDSKFGQLAVGVLISITRNAKQFSTIVSPFLFLVFQSVQSMAVHSSLACFVCILAGSVYTIPADPSHTKRQIIFSLSSRFLLRLRIYVNQSPPPPPSLPPSLSTYMYSRLSLVRTTYTCTYCMEGWLAEAFTNIR